jgi:hypothetical protein
MVVLEGRTPGLSGGLCVSRAAIRSLQAACVRFRSNAAALGPKYAPCESSAWCPSISAGHRADALGDGVGLLLGKEVPAFDELDLHVISVCLVAAEAGGSHDGI